MAGPGHAQASDTSQPQPALVPAGESRAFWIGLVVMVLSLVSGLATYLILTNLTPIAPRGEVVLAVLALNVALILAMVGVIGWQMHGLWQSWRRKEAGSRLHIRIVGLFSLIAALPAIVLAIAATTSFARGLDAWFGSRPRQIIESSVQMATSYLEEHGRNIRTDIVAMGRDLDNAPVAVRTNPKRLNDLLVAQAGLRELVVADVIDTNGHVAIKGTVEQKSRTDLPPQPAIEQARAGQVPVEVALKSSRVWAVVNLQSYPGFLLYVERQVNPQVVRYLQETQARLAEYQQLRRARGPLTVVHGLMYVMTALTALLAAIWVGFWFAGRFVDPIGRIIGAAQQVSRGNLRVELPVIRGEGDLRRLSQTFNTMTSELRTQRDALMSANEQLLDRRRFIEAVLSGVSAGVLGLDTDGRIRIWNRSAERLLGLTGDKLVGRPLGEAVPEFAELMSDRSGDVKTRSLSEAKIQINGEERIFSVRLTHQGDEDRGAEHGAADHGTVITFDDITELVSAQRTSAWGEVARRMAHEIKNPLTPIILSAERIRRKYGRAIVDDRETFDKLTATIERQAGDIKTMVDEFASFARIPKPVMETCDLREAVQEPVILFRESHPALTYVLKIPEKAVIASFDRRLLTQALTNLVKNATEAVESALDPARPDRKGRVEAQLNVLDDRYEIAVIDNGPGLPKTNRKKLLEPYVTTKGAKGTGLGLAIVQKIVEQHGGTMTLEDAPGADDSNAARDSTGAMIRLTLPLARSAAAESAADKPAAAE